MLALQGRVTAQIQPAQRVIFFRWCSPEPVSQQVLKRQALQPRQTGEMHQVGILETGVSEVQVGQRLQLAEGLVLLLPGGSC